MRKSLSLMLATALVMGTAMTAQAGLERFLIHEGNNDPLTEFGDTGLVWGGNGGLTPSNAGDLDSDGNPIGENSYAAAAGATDGWVDFGGPFAAAGLDGSEPWYFRVRMKYLQNESRGGNIYLRDGPSDWDTFFYPDRIVHMDVTDAETLIMEFPGSGFHDIIIQYLPDDGGTAQWWVDGDLKLALTRSDIATVTSDYAGFGGHSSGCCSSESYWSRVELGAGIIIPEPASLTLLGLGGLAMLRRRR